MNLPAAFTEVSYFDDEFRGDLIIVEDAIYFFPTRRSGYNRVYLFDGPIDRIANFLLKGILLLVTGVGVTDLWEFVANIGRVGHERNGRNAATGNREAWALARQSDGPGLEEKAR